MSRSVNGTNRLYARTDRSIRKLKRILQRQSRRILNRPADDETQLNDAKRTHNLLRAWI